ncbi:hypothetical protein JW698_01495 [Candidatus Wolfebacteria bacterium]|nr:hypothetical protein [Candidatus Wolfebacteria bacterium]
MIKKGHIILKILESLKDTGLNTIDLFDAFLSAGYGASLSKIDYEMERRSRIRERKEAELAYQRQIKQRYYNFIYKLKQNGLIKENKKNNKKFFILTLKGKEKLTLLKKRKKEEFPTRYYQKESGNKFIIIIFDIPEKERGKRAWLRAVLQNLDFKLIQKSVWIGKTKIPKNFLEDLLKLKLINFVEIFEISKTGSLEQVV